MKTKNIGISRFGH